MFGTVTYPWKETGGTLALTLTNLDGNSLYSETVMALGYGTKLSVSPKNVWYAGLSGKYLMHTYNWDADTQTRASENSDQVVTTGNSASGISVDAGVLGFVGDNISVGLTGRNLTQPNVGLKYEDKVPMEVRGGVGYKMNPETVIAADVSYRLKTWGESSENMDLHLGVETWLKGQPIAVRAGYDMKDGVAAGFSYLTKAGSESELRVDYALLWSLTIPDNMGSHRVGVNLAWGKVPVAKVEVKRIIVTAETSLPGVSPNGDGEQDTVDFTLACSEKNVAAWKFEIKRDLDIIRVHEGTGTVIPVITWNVTNSANQTVTDGKYSFGLIVKTEENKIYTSELRDLIVDTKPPTAKLSVNIDKFTPDGDGKEDSVTFTCEAADDVGIGNSKLTIVDSNNKQIRKFENGQRQMQDIIWDGKDDYYNRVVGNGNYIARLNVYDSAGNKATANVNVAVAVPQQVVVKEVVREVIKEVIKEVPKEVQVEELPEGLKLTLGSAVLFDKGKSQLKSAALPTLDKIIQMLQQKYPESKIRVEGHTDSVGSQSLNNLLSDLRARGVADYFIEKGVSFNRISCRGFGSTKPVASNTSEDGRSKNRRVEIVISR